MAAAVQICWPSASNHLTVSVQDGVAADIPEKPQLHAAREQVRPLLRASMKGGFRRSRNWVDVKAPVTSDNVAIRERSRLHGMGYLMSSKWRRRTGVPPEKMISERFALNAVTTDRSRLKDDWPRGRNGPLSTQAYEAPAQVSNVS